MKPFKAKARVLGQRNRGISLEDRMDRLSAYLEGGKSATVIVQPRRGYIKSTTIG